MPSLKAQKMWKNALTDDFDGVKRRLDRTSTYIRQFITLTEYRVSIERRQARDLLSVPLRDMAGSEVYESFTNMQAYFVSLAQKRAESIIAFCEHLDTDVLVDLKILLEEEIEVLGPLLNEGRKLVNELQKSYRIHDDSVLAFDAACRVADAAVEELTSGGSRPRLKAAEAARIATEREAAYAQGVAQVNIGRKIFIQNIEPVFDAVENFESKRITKLNDIYRKFHIYEIQLIKSLEYDVNQHFDHECLLAEVQIAAFSEVEQQEFTKKRGKSPKVEIFAKETNQLVWPELQTSLRRAGEEISTEKTSFLEDLISGKLRTDGIRQEVLDKIVLTSEEFAHLKGRCEAVLTETETSLEFTVSLEVLGVAGKIFDADGEALNIQLYDHPFWNLLVFWEAALSAAITDCFFILPHRERSGVSEFRRFANLKLSEFRTLAEGLGLSTDTLIEVTDKILVSHAEILTPEYKAIIENALAPPKVTQPPRVSKPRTK
jgi:hypothetical protein